MPIKLLPKSEIDKLKSSDRQREIDEGVKLAKKVDALREIQSQEEVSLTKFRNETVKVIVSEINAKILERDALIEKIAERRHELLLLSGPIDRAWLFYVNSEKKAIDKLKSESETTLTEANRTLLENQDFTSKMESIKEKELLELQEKREKWEEYTKIETSNLDSLKADTQKHSIEAAKKLIESQKLFKQNENEKFRLEKLHRETSETFENAQQLFDSGKKIVLDAESQSRVIIQSAKRTEKLAIKRNADAATRETNVRLKEEALAQKEREVEDRELAALAKELMYYSPVKRKDDKI